MPRPEFNLAVIRTVEESLLRIPHCPECGAQDWRRQDPSTTSDFAQLFCFNCRLWLVAYWNPLTQRWYLI